MIPDEPAQSPTSDQTLRDAAPGAGVAGSSRSRFLVMVLAVAFAAGGLLSLVAVLASAFLGGTVWPGFVLATYFCLPIAFLLMVSLVVWSAIARRRS